MKYLFIEHEAIVLRRNRLDTVIYSSSEYYSVGDISDSSSGSWEWRHIYFELEVTEEMPLNSLILILKLN